MTRIAVLDDYQGAALCVPAWQRLTGRATVEVFRDTLHREDELARRLAPFEILVLIRERTRFPASLLAKLPELELLALTGRNLGQVDAAAATERGILLTDTEGSGASPVELTIGLMLATVRRIPQENSALRGGSWQTSIGVELKGKTLGILGLGRIGSRIAAFGQFLGMRVLAWGPTLTEERAAASGVTRVPVEQLFRESDVVSVHLRLSDTSRGLVTSSSDRSSRTSWHTLTAAFLRAASTRRRPAGEAQTRPPEGRSTMLEYDGPICVLCGVKACTAEPGTKTPPDFCPMPTEPELLADVERAYLEDPSLRRMAVESARTEAAGYCRATRVEEIMDFARRMGWTRLGIAHCVGLMQEAKAARDIFVAGGFSVSTVCCKSGSIDKERVGIRDDEKVRPGQYEALCSPVGQAALLHQAGTEFNVVIGLCVGHDSLFFMHSKAPVTVLVAKDRVLGHNPVAALYTSHSYYRRLTGR